MRTHALRRRSTPDGSPRTFQRRLVAACILAFFFVLVSSNSSFEMSRRRKVRKISEHDRALKQAAYFSPKRKTNQNIKNFGIICQLKKKMSDDVEINKNYTEISGRSLGKKNVFIAF